MALVKCSECRNEVSDKAPACPRCGCPLACVSPAWQPTPVTVTNPGVAAVLSLVLAGAGQVYNGELAKGFAVAVTFISLLFIGFLVSDAGAICFLLAAVVGIAGVVDAYNSCERIARGGQRTTLDDLVSSGIRYLESGGGAQSLKGGENAWQTALERARKHAREAVSKGTSTAAGETAESDRPAEQTLQTAYLVYRNGAQAGPYSLEDLCNQLSRGQISRSDQIWDPKMAEWVAPEAFFVPAVLQRGEERAWEEARDRARKEVQDPMSHRLRR